MEEDRGAILRADVWSLPVYGCGIVGLPEHVQQPIVVNLCRIVRHLNHFGVTSFICANILVSRILCVAAKIADRGIENARYLPKRLLDSPKTSSSESCGFHDCS